MLYAIALGWPKDGRLVIRSLAKPADGSGAISEVSLLGFNGKVDWQQTAEGLVVKLPAEKPNEFTCSLKIMGTDLKPLARMSRRFSPTPRAD